jgi:hypothetical protein
MKHALTAKLVQLHTKLKTFWKDLEWDLARFCLERCGDAIDRLSQYLHTNPKQVYGITTGQVGSSDDVTQSQVIEPEFLFPVDSLDYPWEILWDTFDGPWAIST